MVMLCYIWQFSGMNDQETYNYALQERGLITSWQESLFTLLAAGGVPHN